MTDKQKRLTIDEKLDIITKLDMGARAVDLAEEYGLHESSISRIKNNKERILATKRKLEEFPSNYASKKKNTKLEVSRVEMALYDWFVEMKALDKPVTGTTLQENALMLNALTGGPESFKASNGWLARWKNRHNIRELSIQEDRLLPKEADNDFCETFRDFIRKKGYDRSQIYNADEAGLLWRQLPRRTLISQEENFLSDRRITEDRVTLMVCANADGTHKIPVLIIGEAKKPRCFQNSHRLPIVYEGERSGWMKQESFKEWYMEIFLPELMKKHGPNAKCLLLLDNAPPHASAEELNALSDLCHVMFLPENLPAVVHPMNQGVIEKTRKLFRRFLLEHVLLMSDVHDLKGFFETWGILKACNGIAVAWNGVTGTNIKNAFRKLLGDAEIEEYEEILDGARFREWVNQIPGFDGITQEETITWLRDDNDQGWRIKDDEVNLDGGKNVEDEEGMDGGAEEKVSLSEALEGVERFKEWYQTRFDSSPDEIYALEEHAAFLRRSILGDQNRL